MKKYRLKADAVFDAKNMSEAYKQIVDYFKGTRRSKKYSEGYIVLNEISMEYLTRIGWAHYRSNASHYYGKKEALCGGGKSASLIWDDDLHYRRDDHLHCKHCLMRFARGERERPPNIRPN